MIYLLLGEDSVKKDEKIAEIKKKVLVSKDAFQIDYEVLHSNKLKPEALKKALISLPAISKQRLVVVRSIEKLDQQNKDLILDFLKIKEESIVLVLDCSKADGRSAFLKKITAIADVKDFGTKEKQNVFDMTNAISACDGSAALKILYDLMSNGEVPVRILGALVWFWSNKVKRRLSKDKYKKGLLELQEADLNIKRSRLSPEHALEVLVVNLCSLIA